MRSTTPQRRTYSETGQQCVNGVKLGLDNINIPANNSFTGLEYSSLTRMGAQYGNVSKGDRHCNHGFSICNFLRCDYPSTV